MSRGFIYRVSVLAFGNFGALAISLAAVPILTRLYSAQDYGNYGVFVSVLALVSPIASLRLDAAVVLPKSRENASSLFWLAGLSIIVFAILVFLGLSIFRFLHGEDAFSFIPGTSWYGDIIFIFTLTFQCLGTTGIYWLLRTSHVGAITKARLSEVLIEKGFAISAGLAHWGSAGLLVGRTLGAATVSVAVFLQIKSLASRPMYDRRRWREDVKQYKSNIVYGPAVSLIGEMSQWLPIAASGFLFDKAVAGYILLSRQLLAGPLIGLGIALQRVMLSDASKSLGEDQFHTRCLSLLKSFLPFSIMSISVLFVFGDVLSSRFLSKEWDGVGGYIAILSISYFAAFVHLSFSGLFDALQAHKIRVSYDSVLLIVRVGGLFVLALYVSDPKKIFAITSVLAAIVYLACVVHLMRIIGIPRKALAEVIAVYFIIPVIAAATIFRGHQTGMVSNVFALCALLAVGTLFFVSLIRKRPTPWKAPIRSSVDGDSL